MHWPRQDFLDIFFEVCGGGEKGKISKKFAVAREEICKARIWDTNSCVGLHSRTMFVWDSCFAATHVSAQWVDDLAKVKPLGALADLHRIKARLPIYRQRAANFTVNYASVENFSSSVLEWWRENDDDPISAWSEAARIVFAISPNSASCERVFALVKTMFGEQQLSTLADYIQAALMLRSNDRAVG